MATLIFWVEDENTARDRNTSGTTRGVRVPDGAALATARRLVAMGDAGLAPAYRGALAGHGVTIVYDSGRTRHVRRD